MPREHTWIQSVRCVVCDKTGMVPDPDNPEKQIKCDNCGGAGYHTTRGRTKAD